MPHDCCWECGEPLARDYGRPVLCNDCWRWTAPDDRGQFVKANRNDEETVIRNKAKSRRQP